MTVNSRALATAALLLLPTLAAAAGGDVPAKVVDPLHGLEYRLIGPAAGGRVARVTGVAGDPLTYYLAAKPAGEINLEILDSAGTTVRRLSSTKKPVYTPLEHPDWNPDSENEPGLEVEPGSHRAVWDLRFEGAKWMPDARFDTGEPGAGPLVLPGTYTLRLTVDGRSETRELEVEPDPRSEASAADLEAQLTFSLGIRDQLTRIAGMVATIRSVRQQIEDRNTVLAADSDAEELIESGARLIADLTAIEEVVHNPHAEVNYDVLAGRHGGAMLYSRLSWLLMGADDHDGPPTQGMLEVGAELAAALATQEAALEELLSGDLTALNRQAQERTVPFVLVPALAGD